MIAINVVEKALIEGVVFTAQDLGDGGPPLFRWTHEALELECSMGQEDLLVAANDALREISYAKLERTREAFDLVLKLASISVDTDDRGAEAEIERQFAAIETVRGYRP